MTPQGTVGASLAGARAAGRGAAGGGGGGGGLQGFSNIMAVAGVGVSAIGAFFAASSARYAGRSRALNLEYEASLAGINAELADLAEASAIRAGRGEFARVTEQFGRLRSSARVEQAASGLQAGVGSSAEVLASIEVVKARETSTISMNTVRAANAARLRAIDLRNRALLNRVSAFNIRQQANNISPFLAGATSLVGSAGPVASQFISQGGRG